jgi:ABC-type oligopeptide transport system ATPase subunit
MAGTLELIRDWATELPYWEQAALERIASLQTLTEHDYEELLNYCMQDAGLIPTTARPQLSFPTKLPGLSKRTGHKLERLFNLQNVNALPSGQEIRFGDQLTIIYGGNGAGKTGYTRPLGCATWARGEREVLPDARHPENGQLPQADIEVSANEKKKVLTWTIGARLPEMAGIHVFDGISLNAHLTRPNALTFAPAGLSLLTKLAEVTDVVRERLRKLAETKATPHQFSRSFSGESAVSKFIAGLSGSTDPAALTKLASLFETEETRAKELDHEIAKLKSQDVSKRIAILKQEGRDLEHLLDQMMATRTGVSNEAEVEVRHLLDLLKQAQEEVESSGAGQFKSERFTQVGTDAWRNFVQAARSLAERESKAEGPYPQGSDPCLLCRQALSPEATDLIRRLWAFLSSNAPAQLRAAKDACTRKLRELERLNLTYFGEDTAARRLLDSDAGAVIAIAQFVNSSAKRLERLMSALRSEKRPEEFVPPPTLATEAVEVAIQRRKQEIAELESSDIGKQLQVLSDELRELSHRKTLAGILPDMKRWITEQGWAARASEAGGSTRHITAKYNELFSKLVADLYRSTFQENLSKLKRHLKVTIETRGQKGETVRQIVLSPEAFAQTFAVEKVLSDGEKRAVALADFISEATLDPQSTAMVFDDPVSSLDSDSREAVAKLLAEEAGKHQVVIFTHELAFVHALKAAAKELSVGVTSHWVVAESGQPGYVYQNNGPLCESDFKSAKLAREQYVLAKAAGPAERERHLQQGFGYLRSSYEYLVVYDLFNDVVRRFDERISFDRLKEVTLEKEIVDKVVEKLGDLSRHIDAHLHSDTFAADKPTPELLYKEIEQFEDLKRRIKATKRPVAVAPVPAMKPATTSEETKAVLGPQPPAVIN